MLTKFGFNKLAQFLIRKRLLPSYSKLSNWTTQKSWICTTLPSLSHAIVQHRDTSYNNLSLPFEFNSESKTRIERVLSKFPSNYKQSAVIALLYIAQEQNNNWIPLSAMNKIAELLDMAPIRVYEVATFYTMFNRIPVGKFHLQVCGTTPCQLCGAEQIIRTIEQHLHIKSGDTTKDGFFTLSEVECLGACVNAPMMQINNHHFYEYLTPENTVKLLEDLRNGREVKTNNQNHVYTCEGPIGQTSLNSPQQPICRDLDALKRDLIKEEAEKKAAAKK